MRPCQIPWFRYHFFIHLQVLYLPSDSGYLVYKPFRYEKLNVKKVGDELHSGGAYSLSHAINILEDLWSKAIEDYLDIEKKDFKVRRGNSFFSFHDNISMLTY